MEEKGIVFTGKGSISSIVISTALGEDGGGIFPRTLLRKYRGVRTWAEVWGVTRITKSLTRFPRQGNFSLGRPWTWGCIRSFGERGMLNSYGLTNMGVEKAAPRIERVIAADNNVIPNLFPEFAKGRKVAIDEILEAIRFLYSVLGSSLWAVELNFSCPNSEEEIAKNMQDAVSCVTQAKMTFPQLVLIAKTSIVHPLDFCRQLEDVGIDAIHGVNTIPYYHMYDDRQPSPLHKLGGGGISGGPAFGHAKKHLEQLRNCTDLPLIMGCGATHRYAVGDYFKIGADAVSICTSVLRFPEEACHIIKCYCEA